MKKALLFTLVLFISSFGITQNVDYSPLISKGKIPKNFSKSSVDKFESDLSKIDKDKKKKQAQIKENFLLKSNFSVNELLLSGKVLFNDEVTQYLKLVKNYLLKDQPELREKIQIYAVRSSGVNAFTVSSGEIFINIGLVAHLSSEADLAFIISHEIQHYLKKHSINQYVYTRNLATRKNIRKGLTLGGFLRTKSKFSREQESEADLEGYNLFSKTSYSLSAVKSAFDILAYSPYPWDTSGLDFDLFSEADIRLPESLFSDSTGGFLDLEHIPDSLHSHPNIASRRKALANHADDKDVDKGISFVFGKEKFEAIRKIARIELCNLFIKEGSFGSAIVNSYHLKRSKVELQFLNLTIARALFGFARHKVEGKFNEVNLEAGEAGGYSEEFSHIINNLEPYELTALALVYCWRIRQKIGQNEELDQINQQLMSDLKSYYPEFVSHILDQNDSLFKDTPSAGLWTQEMKRLLESSAFSDAFEKTEVVEPEEDTEQELSRKEVRNKKRKRALEGYSLGLDKVVFINPGYRQVDARKKNPVRYLASEEKREEEISLIAENAQKIGLDFEILSVKNLESGDVDKFNDIAFLNEWLESMVYKGDITGMAPNDMEIRRQIIEKYGTKYFAWFGIEEAIWKSRARYMVLYYIWFLWALPVTLYILTGHENTAVFYNLVFDLETGKPVMVDLRHLNRKPRYDLTQSLIYYSLFQMKRK